SRMAIKSFNRPLVWILGGVDKNLSFSQLIKTAQKNPQLKALVFLKGDASQKIIAEAQKSLPNITKTKPFDNFNKAINAAYRLANKGDIVLLSPAAASFGMFKNEFDRGNQFKKIVNDLAQKETTL
ncbi:MAG: UDP-N-acetylmuramoyl-L-alanine--D-glutamate ligase, partial [Candidatus Shapirobacteria bacterium]|nr:UDP-N-acetylmuramoyl-L-alanine--D-glutamate ligase [Candidatus Shapirobacteria bacterium]